MILPAIMTRVIKMFGGKKDKLVSVRVPKSIIDALDNTLPGYSMPTKIKILYDFSAVRLENYLRGNRKK